MPRRNLHDEDIETFRKRTSINVNGFYNYRMWLFDMGRDSNDQTVSNSEIAKQLESFRKRKSINGNGFYNYRMWLFDMTRDLNEKMKRKMLRESILSCFSHLICLNYIPTAIYKQLMYWLDDEVIKDGEIVEKTTY